MEEMRITTQLYTVRDELTADYSATLSKLAGYGLEFVELGGLDKEKATEWKGVLDDAGLKVSGAHYGLAEMDNADALFEVMNVFNCKNIIVPWVPADTFANLESIKEFAGKLDVAGAAAHEAGFNYLYHNHDFEFVKHDGLTGWEHLVNLTDPKNLSFEVDVAWVKIGGMDEVALLEKYADRIGLLHLKDFDPAKTPRWTIAGEGTVNMDAVLKFGDSRDIPYGAIELDESPVAPMDAVRHSFDYFKSKGYR